VRAGVVVIDAGSQSCPSRHSHCAPAPGLPRVHPPSRLVPPAGPASRQRPPSSSSESSSLSLLLVVSAPPSRPSSALPSARATSSPAAAALRTNTAAASCFACSSQAAAAASCSACSSQAAAATSASPPAPAAAPDAPKAPASPGQSCHGTTSSLLLLLASLPRPASAAVGGAACAPGAGACAASSMTPSWVDSCLRSSTARFSTRSGSLQVGWRRQEREAVGCGTGLGPARQLHPTSCPPAAHLLAAAVSMPRLSVTHPSTSRKVVRLAGRPAGGGGA